MVYEIRDLWENASVDRGRFAAGSPLYRIARGLESYVVRNAGAVVTICDLLKNEIAPRAGNPDKVHVIANGVDTDAFRPQDSSEPLKRRWGLIDKEVILYAGTFQPYEGLDLLIRAMAEVVRSRPSAHLVIVGGSAGFAGGAGPVSPEEKRACWLPCRTAAWQPHVTFTGRIPHADVKAMYALADVLCYPRRMTLDDGPDDAAEAAGRDGDGQACHRQRCAGDVRARFGRSDRPGLQGRRRSAIWRANVRRSCQILSFGSGWELRDVTGSYASGSGLLWLRSTAQVYSTLLDRLASPSRKNSRLSPEDAATRHDRSSAEGSLVL